MSAMLDGGGFVTQPPDDLPTASQSTLLLQKKKEMAEVQQQLERKKEEFRARMQRCQEKEVDLAARQEDIKEQVRKFDKFLKDNDAKRVRADRKVQEERKATTLKEAEKRDLEEQLKKLRAARQQLQEEVVTKGKFQGFLDSVCDDLPEYFESIEQIMMRHETLKAAYDDLLTRDAASQRAQEEENNELQKFMKRKQNEVLVYTSDIATKQEELDKLRYSTTDTEAALSKTDEGAKEGKRELGEIEMAIHNIHARCRTRGPLPEALETYLEDIKTKMVDKQAIVTGREGPVGVMEITSLMRMRMGASAASSGGAAGPAPEGGADAMGKSSSKVEGGGNASTRGPGASMVAGSQTSPGSISGSLRPSQFGGTSGVGGTGSKAELQ